MHNDMRALCRSIYMFGLVAATGAAFGEHPAALEYGPRCSRGTNVTVTAVSDDVSLIELPSGVAVEQLRGDAARAHLRNLQSRRPSAFVAAKKALAARGYTETDDVFVERTFRGTRSAYQNGSSNLRIQNYMEQNADGEIVYSSWTDGDDRTWEGTIYVEIYSDGAASTWDGQIDASTDDHPWVWHEMTWQRAGSIEPEYDARWNRSVDAPRDVYLARSASRRPGPYLLVGKFFDWANCHRANVVGGCVGGAVGCVLTGPGWAGCFGATCVGVQVASAITCYLN